MNEKKQPKTGMAMVAPFVPVEPALSHIHACIYAHTCTHIQIHQHSLTYIYTSMHADKHVNIYQGFIQGGGGGALGFPPPQLEFPPPKKFENC